MVGVESRVAPRRWLEPCEPRPDSLGPGDPELGFDLQQSYTPWCRRQIEGDRILDVAGGQGVWVHPLELQDASGLVLDRQIDPVVAVMQIDVPELRGESETLAPR